MYDAFSTPILKLANIRLPKLLFKSTATEYILNRITKDKINYSI